MTLERNNILLITLTTDIKNANFGLWYIHQCESSMLPSEMIILLAIVIDRKKGDELRNQPMDVTGKYIGYLYDSLVNRGYLKQHGAKSYQLTTMGRETLFDFMRTNKTRSSEFVSRLQQLGIQITPEQEQKISELGKEVVKANLKI